MKHTMSHTLVPSAGLLLCLILLPALSSPVRAQQADTQSGVELVLATDIQDREPVGVAERFAADVGRVYAWMRVTGLDGEAVQVVWSHGDHTSTVPLEIGGSPWRTWSTRTIPPEWTGPWSVSVVDADGNVLARADFTVGAGAP